MDLFDRLQLTIKHTPGLGRGFNSVSKMMDIYSSLGETLSRRSITRDFVKLESSGLLEFVKYEGTAKLYCQPGGTEPTFSSNLAWVLIALEEPIKRLCNEEMLQSIEAELSLAKQKLNDTEKYEPQSKLCQFGRKIGSASALAKSNASTEIINPIKEAIWDESLELRVKGIDHVSIQTIKNVSLKLIDKKLYLCGKICGELKTTLSVPLNSVQQVNKISRMPFQSYKPLLKAA